MEKMGCVFMRGCTGRGRRVPWPQAWDPSQELTWEGLALVQAPGKGGGRLDGVGGQAEVGDRVTSLLVRAFWDHQTPVGAWRGDTSLRAPPGSPLRAAEFSFDHICLRTKWPPCGAAV